MKRYVISPGILQEVGQDPAYVAGVMLNTTLDDSLFKNVKVERKAWTLHELMAETGVPKNPLKYVLRRLMKRQIVVETLKGVYRLTWSAMLHHLYVRDRVVVQANDGLYITAQRYKQQQEIKELLGDGEEDSADHNDDNLHGRDNAEVHAEAEGTPEAEGTVEGE